MKKFLVGGINFLLSLLPRFLECKIRLFLHLLTEDWYIPPAFPFSNNFYGKIPDNWQKLFSDVDKKSI